MKKQKFVTNRDPIIRLIIILAAIVSFLMVFVPPVAINVASHSVYYAQQANQGKNHELELQMLIDHLSWMTVPEDSRFKFDFDGRNAITYESLEEGKETIVFSNAGEGYDYFNDLNTYYCFDEDFQIEYAKEQDFNKLLPKDIDQEAVKEELYEDMLPVIEAQGKPIINLQWVFNLYYWDRVH